MSGGGGRGGMMSSAADEESKRLNNEALQRQEKQATKDAASLKAKEQREAGLMAAGRTGARSLFSGDWSGFQRGGDLGPS